MQFVRDLLERAIGHASPLILRASSASPAPPPSRRSSCPPWLGSSSCRRRGVHRPRADTAENKLIPVDDWGAFADKGGLPGMISWLPIKEIAETLIRLYEARDKAKQILYEITGIGDIMRGARSEER